MSICYFSLLYITYMCYVVFSAIILHSLCHYILTLPIKTCKKMRIYLQECLCVTFLVLKKINLLVICMHLMQLLLFVYNLCRVIPYSKYFIKVYINLKFLFYFT